MRRRRRAFKTLTDGLGYYEEAILHLMMPESEITTELE